MAGKAQVDIRVAVSFEALEVARAKIPVTFSPDMTDEQIVAAVRQACLQALPAVQQLEHLNLVRRRIAVLADPAARGP